MSTTKQASYRPAGYVRRRLPWGGSLLTHRRSGIVTLLLTVTALLLAVATLLTGAYEISPGQALDTLLTGSGSNLDRFIVIDQRLPRVIAALLVGVALGTSGAIFQSTSRNPLASPDIIGFTTGAASGGLLMILVIGTATSRAILLGTVVGGALTAVVVVTFALRRGLTGDRLILSGIAIGAMLAAVNDYLLSRAPIEAAETAKAWQHGSLNAISWLPILPLALTLAVCLPATLAMVRTIRALELGDDAAAGTGVPIVRARLTSFAIGIALAAIAVATAGPIGFLALAAPQLARRLSHSPGVAVVPSMAMGAVVLAAADLLAQRLLSPFQIPVGLVTAAVGGIYLVWLLTMAPDGSGRGFR